MSSVYGNLDFKDADFEISPSSPTQCTNGSMHSGSEDPQEPDGDETGYINQIENEESGKSSSGSFPPKSSNDEEKDENFTTKPAVLIPAIKGSREKYGLSLKKFNVSWAEDVYDPPPSIASHTRRKKQKSKSKDSHKKAGKKGQKSKDKSSSRGGSSKEKKQSSRKHSRDEFEWANLMPIVAASS